MKVEAGKKNKKDDKKSKKKDGKGIDKLGDETTMSEEDQELKERLETCVSTVVNEGQEAAVTVPLRIKALDIIVTELRSATSSMTSVPKPLKFLRPQFAKIKGLHVSLTKADPVADGKTLVLRARLADVLAVLAMTMGKPGKFFRRLLYLTNVNTPLTFGLLSPCHIRGEGKLEV